MKVIWAVTNVSANTSFGANPTDDVSLVFYNPESQEAMLIEGCAKRVKATFDAVLPDVWAGSEIHSWIYFSKAGTGNSNSEYVGIAQL